MSDRGRDRDTFLAPSATTTGADDGSDSNSSTRLAKSRLRSSSTGRDSTSFSSSPLAFRAGQASGPNQSALHTLDTSRFVRQGGSEHVEESSGDDQQTLLFHVGSKPLAETVSTSASPKQADSKPHFFTLPRPFRKQANATPSADSGATATTTAPATATAGPNTSKFATIAHSSPLAQQSRTRRSPREFHIPLVQIFAPSEPHHHHHHQQLQEPNQTKRGEHVFVPYQNYSGRPCDICSKTISKWGDSKQGLQCEACGVACHKNCLPLITAECLIRPELHAKQAMTTIAPEQPASSGMAATLQPDVHVHKRSVMDSVEPRVTKTSSFFLRLRLEAERQNPSLDSPYYQSWIDMLLDFVKSTAKFLHNGGQPWSDLLDVFQQTSQMNIKHAPMSESEKKDLLLQAKDACKRVILDHAFYAKAFVKLTDICIEDFAEELALEDSRLYNSITAADCYGTAWIKKDKAVRSPSVVACIDQFNKLTLFVVSSILTKKNATGRASYIVYFVKLAQACRHLHNYNSLNAILNGLDSTPIYRLKKSWEHVSSRYVAVLKELKTLMSAERNFEQLRNCLKALKAGQSPAHIVPYLGMFLSDLAYVDAAYPSNPEVRSEKSAELIIQIASFQGVCPFAPILGLQDYVRSLPACNEEENYSMSLQREPKLDNKVPAIDKVAILKSLEGCDINELRNAYASYSRREKEVAAEVNMLYEHRQRHEERGVRWVSQEKSAEAWDLMNLVSQLGKMLAQEEERLSSVRISAVPDNMDEVPAMLLRDASEGSTTSLLNLPSREGP